MYKTEKRHWLNGYQVRGKNFKTLTMSMPFINIGVMISGNNLTNIKLTFYKLVSDLKYKIAQDCINSDWSGILD